MLLGYTIISVVDARDEVSKPSTLTAKTDYTTDFTSDLTSEAVVYFEDTTILKLHPIS